MTSPWPRTHTQVPLALGHGGRLRPLPGATFGAGLPAVSGTMQQSAWLHTGASESRSNFSVVLFEAPAVGHYGPIQLGTGFWASANLRDPLPSPPPWQPRRTPPVPGWGWGQGPGNPRARRQELEGSAPSPVLLELSWVLDDSFVPCPLLGRHSSGASEATLTSYLPG